MIKQLFNFTLDSNYTGNTKFVWTLPKSMLTIPSELQEVSKYKFNCNGTDYTCTGVYEGATKYFFTYKPEDSSTAAIEIQYFKDEDKLELAMRPALIEFSIGDVVKLLEEVDEPTPPTPGDDELVDDTYEIKLRSTTTFNRYAIVDTEVTMKKPDDKAVNYVADEAVVKVNGVEVSGGGGYPEPTGIIEITENGTVNVKDYAEANVNVTQPVPPVPDEVTISMYFVMAYGADDYDIINKYAEVDPHTGEAQFNASKANAFKYEFTAVPGRLTTKSWNNIGYGQLIGAYQVKNCSLSIINEDPDNPNIYFEIFPGTTNGEITLILNT